MTRFFYLLSAAAIAAILGACTVTVSDGGDTGDTVDKTVNAKAYTNANLDGATPADSVTLAPGESYVYSVNVPTTDLAALYLYLDTTFDLYVYRASGLLYATSASTDFFAGGTSGLSPAFAQSELGPSAVAAQLICPGSCVILPSGASDPVEVHIENTSNDDAEVSFYAVLRDFEDSSEAAYEPILLEIGTSAQGALETLADIDRYEVELDGVLQLLGKVQSPIEFAAEITRSDGSTVVLSDGQSANVNAFDIVRVYAANAPSRAASAGNSSYSLFLD